MWNCTSSIFWIMSFRNYWLKKNIVFSTIIFFIYIVNRLIKSYINIPIVGYICKCHLNDFIGGMLFCSYVNIVLVLNSKKPLIKLNNLIIFMFMVSIAWEYIFPLILSYSTSDIFDVLSYLLGTIAYHLFVKKTVLK